MTNQQPTGGFAKAFVPGLVLGIIIGAFAGATLPALLAEKKLPEHTGVPSGTTRTEREREVPPPDTLIDPELDPTLDTPPGEGEADGDDAAETGEQVPPPDDDATGEDDASGEDDG
ncbi:MAG: hypothetical protein ACF8LK_04140 [Phycisphaerales bacterium JB041]